MLQRCISIISYTLFPFYLTLFLSGKRSEPMIVWACWRHQWTRRGGEKATFEFPAIQQLYLWIQNRGSFAELIYQLLVCMCQSTDHFCNLVQPVNYFILCISNLLSISVCTQRNYQSPGKTPYGSQEPFIPGSSRGCSCSPCTGLVRVQPCLGEQGNITLFSQGLGQYLEN